MKPSTAASILLAGLIVASAAARPDRALGGEDRNERRAEAGQSALTITTPVPYQVVQREGFVPSQAHAHAVGGPARGHAQVNVQGQLQSGGTATLEYRVQLQEGAWGRATDWSPLPVIQRGRAWSGTIDVAAGGWYRLEVRRLIDGRPGLAAAVEPFGVGEVFVIAGQSYAEGANDELLRIDDPHGRVAAFDVVRGSWQVAHDPQPNRGTGGTIWPSLGNHLLPLVQVPIGFVNVASGGTASRQWLPGEALYRHLEEAGRAVGRFRAVLWQQGESDVIENVATETYVQNLTRIRADLAAAWGFAPPWLLAKSTLHPTVYNRPEEEERIRAAIAQLWRAPGFRPGPDTDILDGENRGGPDTRRHFSGIGQRRAGLLWFAAVWNELNRDDSRP